MYSIFQFKRVYKSRRSICSLVCRLNSVKDVGLHVMKMAMEANGRGNLGGNTGQRRFNFVDVAHLNPEPIYRRAIIIIPQSKGSSV